MKYTKADLENIISIQLENLNAMHDLMRIMKLQNDLIEEAHKKMQAEFTRLSRKEYSLAAKRKTVSNL